MDVELAKTFLAVVDTGSFIDAAANVHVTQSTVSMRIKSLEEQLGQTLFLRNKSGATLTPAGEQFQKHALAMVRIWEQARLEVGLPEGYAAALSIGAPFSLWDGFLMQWVAQMRSSEPDIAIRTHTGFSQTLIHRLSEGTIDIGVMYAPQNRPGFEIDLLFVDELVLVTSDGRATRRPGKNYIYVDWGPEFQADHSLNFADLSTPAVHMDLGSLGLAYLLENPAAGYFPLRLVEPYLSDRTLQLVEEAPTFRYPAYVVFPTESDRQIIDPALAVLSDIAKELR